MTVCSMFWSLFKSRPSKTALEKLPFINRLIVTIPYSYCNDNDNNNDDDDDNDNDNHNTTNNNNDNKS